MATPTDATIRPLEGHEWQTLKALRIAALTESPDAFGPTAAEAASQPDDYWQTGVTRPLRDGSPLRNVEMVKRLSD